MVELPGKIRVQDAALANMVSIAAILEYLEQTQPGARAVIERRAQEIARSIRQAAEGTEPDDGGERRG